MVRYSRRNPAKKARKARKARKSRSRAKRARRAPARRRRVAGKRHRITLYKTRSGWSRGRVTRRSAMKGRGPIRVNPKRRRRNPSRSMSISSMGRGIIPSKGFLVQAAAIVGGFAAARMVTPYYSQIPLVNMLGRYTPALNIALGAFAAKKLKGALKPVGIGIAASGVASLLSQFFPQLALSADLGADLGDEGVVRVGDEVVRIAADDGESESVYGGDSVYEHI